MTHESTGSESGPNASADPRPRVSFGLPVRNAEVSVRRCLDSILSQHFRDFEVVLCDNASSDGTRDVLEEYAAKDSRIRLFVNEENIGQIENVNGVFRLSRGVYFRWIGADDWLEPQYASRCIAALDADPEAVAVTTYFRIHADEGDETYEEYCGEWVDSRDPARRLARMLWFFHAGDRKYDPVYSLIRRDTLARTHLIRMMDRADQMLAAELSLLGRFVHVPECLAHRRKSYRRLADKPTLMRRYHAAHHATLPSPPSRLFRVLLQIVRDAELTPVERTRCTWSAAAFSLREAFARLSARLRRFASLRLGLNRRSLRLWARLRR
jgi:glycosyltransferase involved in cell wall biosynthesis